MSAHQTTQKAQKTTLRSIQKMRDLNEKISVLTAYDYVTAAILDRAGTDIILVGDSLGNVVLGFDTTIPVKLDDMIRHTSAVVRGTERALVVLDLPFGSYSSSDEAIKNSVRAFQESGCHAVKLEGSFAVLETVKRLTETGIPVMGHIGLTPQSVHQLGGYYRHGKTDHEIKKLKEAALALQEAGAFSIVLECVIPEIATEITASLKIPTIGIGSGGGCSGQVLVINDLIGLSLNPPPSFAQPKANVAEVIHSAVRNYIEEIKK